MLWKAFVLPTWTDLACTQADAGRRKVRSQWRPVAAAILEGCMQALTADATGCNSGSRIKEAENGLE
jgi:hypothetical protein